MFHLRGKSTVLWRNLIVWLVAAFLIFPQIGYAQDALKEYVTIPDTVTMLLDVDDLYMGSFSKGFQVSASHPCFTVVDTRFENKTQVRIERASYAGMYM